MMEGKITVSNSTTAPLNSSSASRIEPNLLDENDEEYSWVDIDTGTNLRRPAQVTMCAIRFVSPKPTGGNCSDVWVLHTGRKP
jgi:hypothetical protein